MLLLGKIVSVQEEESTECLHRRYKVRISTLHKDLEDEDLPHYSLLTDILGNKSFDNTGLKPNDIVRLFTEDDLFQNIYILGKYNPSTDLTNLLEGLSLTNSVLPTQIKQSIQEYNLNEKDLFIKVAGQLLLIMDGEQDVYVATEKSSGNTFYLDKNEVALYTNPEGLTEAQEDAQINKMSMGKNGASISFMGAEIKISKAGKVSVFAKEGQDISVYGKKVTISGDVVQLGKSVKIGNRYVVTAPQPKAQFVVSGVTYSSSE